MLTVSLVVSACGFPILNDASVGFLVVCILSFGALAVAALVILSGLSKRGGKAEPSGRIPPAEVYFVTQDQAMVVVREILAEQAMAGCRWRSTYDRPGEGRIQARLYGTPAGAQGNQPVDILLNMLFHRLEAEKTEVEWSYVVMSGKSEDADLIVATSNSTFKEKLKQCQKNSAPPSVTKRVLADKSSTSMQSVAADGGVLALKTCFNCHKPIEENLTFCQNCGSSLPT